MDDATETVVENASEGTDLVVASVTGYTLAANIEKLTLGGTVVAGYGNSGTNTITGNASNNSLDGGTGIDTLIGGGGNDTYFVDDATETVVENASEGTDWAIVSASSYSLSTNLENLTYVGTGNATFTGNGGNNRIDASAAGVNNLSGGDGNDTLIVNANRIGTLDGGGGNDTLLLVSNLGMTIGASEFGGFSNIESYDFSQVAGDVNITIGSSAQGLGIATLSGGTANSTLTADSTFGTNPVNTISAVYFTGSSGNDSLSGNSGNDTLLGGSGNDSLIGGSGNDSLDGGAGNDSMVGGLGNDTYIVDSNNDAVVEVADQGTDVVLSSIAYTIGNNVESLILTGSGNHNGTGNSLNNSLTGNSGTNSLTGDSGDDFLDGQAGADTLIGDSGDDSLIGGDGVDSLVGGTGNDTYVIDVVTVDYISETSQSSGGTADQIQVNGSFSIADPPPLPIGVPAPGVYAGIEGLVYAGTSSVTLTGNKLANTITSRSGDDFLDGGIGKDTLTGGAGNDTYIYRDKDYIVESAEEGTDEVRSAEDIDLSAMQNIENIVLTGSLGVGAKGNAADNSIVGNTASNDLYGADGDDTLLGLAGGDLLSGGAGTNSLIGGAGNDTYIIEATENPDGSVTIQDILVEEAGGGTDEIRVAADVDLSQLPDFENVRLIGSGNFNVIGNDLSNTIVGNTGDNILDGGLGGDDLRGGIGNDTYYVDSALDRVSENAGEGTADIVISSVQSWTLSGNIENLKLIGGNGSSGFGNIDPNLITGSASANSLFGDQGDDTILGELGDDYLVGGWGTDSMVGGLGDDTYVIESGSDIIVETSDTDSDTVIIRSRVRANVVNKGQAENIPDAQSITFDVPTGALIGGGAELFLDFKTLQSGELNFQNYAPLPLSGGNVSKNPNYFYVLAEKIERLTIENTFVPINGFIYFDSSNQPDYVYGNSLNNYIAVSGEGLLSNGGLVAFDNYIDGQAGADTMAGGLGSDFYIADNAGDFVLESSGQGTDSVRSSVTYTLSGNVEVLQLADVTESIVDGRPVIDSLSGDDLNFDGYGNADNNSLFGNAGNNSLFGLDGNDYFVGGDLADTMVGGKGNDTYYVADASDWVIESETTGAGLNYIYVEDDALAFTTITGGDAILTVIRQGETYGTESNDTLIGNPLRDTIYGFGGDDLISGFAGNDSLLGGNGNDYISGGDGVDTLIGEDGNDTLLGDAGNNSLFGGAGNDSLVSSGTGIDTFIGGAGNDTLVVGTSLNWAIDGGANTDLLSFVGASVSLNNAVLTNIEAVDFSQLTGNAAITLGGNSTALTTITGGAGSDSISAITGFGVRAITLDGGDGGDRFAFDLIAQMQAASIIGGSGNDSLAFLAGIPNLQNNDLLTIQDSSLEVIELGGFGNRATFAGNAQSAGITTIVGGTNDDWIDASAYTVGITIDVSRNTQADGLLDNRVVGGSSDDLIIFSNHNVLGNSVVDGGNGNDTLSFSEDGISITDERFNANLQNIEAIQTKNGTNYIEIGTNAAADAVFASLIGGTGADTFDASDYDDNINIQAGAGGDVITLRNAARIQSSTLNGGAGSDTLRLSLLTPNLADANLVNMTSVETIVVGFDQNSVLTVGSNALSAGVTQVVGAGGDDRLDASAFEGSINLVGGAGNDTFVVATGDRLVDIGGFGVRISAGTGAADELQFSVDALSITDSDFLGVTGVEALRVSQGNNYVTLGARATTSGISTIFGGTGFDTFSALNMTTGINFVMDARRLGNATGLASLDGGSGLDTLSVNSIENIVGVDFADFRFARVGSVNWAGDLGAIENFETEDGRALTYAFGTNAYAAGIQTVYAHPGDVLNANAFTAGNPATDRALNFVFDTAAGLTIASITGTGSTGNDTLTLTTNGQTVNNATMVNKTSLEMLVLANGNNDITLAANASNAGIRFVVGGTGNDTFNASDAGYTLSASLVGGAGNDSFVGGSGNDTFVGTNSTVFGASERDTFTGGAGNDRFVLGDAANAYYNTAARTGDYAVITDFGTGTDIIQLKDLSATFADTTGLNRFGYVLSNSDVYTIGALGVGVDSYLYVDSDKSGTANFGDNLIAAINNTSGAGGALTIADLTTTRFVTV